MSRFANIARGLSLAACILVGAALAVAADAPARPIDPSYITPDAAIAAVLHPHLVLTQPKLELLPIEVLSALGIKELGIDPVEVDEVLLIAANVVPPAKGAGADAPRRLPDYGAVIRLRQAVKAAELQDKLFRDTTAAKLDQFDIRQAAARSDPLGVMPSFYLTSDGKTIVAAQIAFLKQMLAVKTPTGPIVTLLKQFDSNTQLGIVQSMDVMRADLNAQIANLPVLPPALDNLKKLPDLLAAVKFSVSLRDKLSWNLVFAARDAKSAEETEQTLAAALQFGKQLAAAQMMQNQQSAPNANDPVQQALRRFSQRMLDESFAQMKPVRKEQLVSFGGTVLTGPAMGGMLLAITLPAVNAARAAARNAQSLNNLSQLVRGMMVDESESGHLPARAIFDAKGKPLLSWRVHLLPYLEQEQLYKQFHLDEPWDSEHNKPLVEKMPEIFAKPGRDPSDHKTVYLVPVGKGTVFGGDKGMKSADIKDGASNTILILEADDDKAVIWTKPDDLDVDLAKPLNGLGHASPRGFNATFADGHGQSIPASVDPEVLKALFTANGGEAVDVVDLLLSPQK